jgi:hypothetical protein
MPASERSLQITDAYRSRLIALSDRMGAYTAQKWRSVSVENLDRSHAGWLASVVPALDQAQRAGSLLTAAYLAAFIASELGHATPDVRQVDPGRALGAADGQPLEVPLSKTLIGVKAALKDGKSPTEALAEQQHRAQRLAVSATMVAPRRVLAEEIASDSRIVGWRRVTRGGCGACLALAAKGFTDTEPLKVHDHCHCTAEPVIRDVEQTARRATGPELFVAMSAAQQDQALGPAAAQAVREGRVSWPDLVATSPMKVGPDQITQAPVGAAI